MSKENLKLYEKFKTTPQEARKVITAGRLKGFTDINPMWRIKMLTEEFGVCGIGWYPEITDKRLETSPTGEVKAFVDIKLYIKVNGEWSQGIEATGGASFVSNEAKGLYTNDECFKSAYTDALGVACKMLGMSADIYFDKDSSSKYQAPQGEPKQASADTRTQEQINTVVEIKKKTLAKMCSERCNKQFTVADINKRIAKEGIKPEDVEPWLDNTMRSINEGKNN